MNGASRAADHLATFADYRFTHNDAPVEATVFPIDGVRQAPISPIDGKPMRRAGKKEVLALLDQSLQ